MSDMQQTPLPCPFCGSINIRMHKSNVQLLYCGDCHQKGPAVPSLSGTRPPTDEEKAIVLMMWNHRDDTAKPLREISPVTADKVGQDADKDIKLTLNGIQIH